VFDLHAHSHHATNQQVLVEIAALSSCQFLVHGLSAVSEAAIWMNSDGLYRRSVNLEDPERVGIAEFATLVQIVRRNESENRWPATSYRTDDWWNTSRYHEETKEQFGRQTIQDCSNYRGVLHVASVGYNSSAGPAFFTHVLNQLLYARNHQLLPWIHLDAASGAQSLFDDQYHKNADHASEILEIKRVPVRSNSPSAQYPYPGPPDASQSPHETSYSIQGNGVWESYFAPVASWTDVKACIGEGKSLFTLAPEQVSPGLDSYSADSVKAWRYDTVPDLMWPSTSDELKQLYERMRRTGHDLVKSYFRFRPYLLRRADRINPQSRSEAHRPCLGVHFRNGDKSGAHRRKVPLEKYLPYLQTFVEAGGEVLYVASDSHAILQYMEKVAPPDVWSKVRTQGNHVVRSAPNKKNPKATGWPSHMIGSHHRVNAETLVDVLGLSNCRWLVHTQSTVAEASIYLNMDLHNSSVNLEDTHKMTPLQFGDMIRADLKELRAKSVAAESLPVKSFSMRPLVTSHLDNATIIKRHRSVRGGCRTNAIVYLAQKRHSSYGRDSYAILQNSLKMLYRNYLSDPKHMNNTDLFIFHTGDFNQSDLVAVERSLGPSSRGAVHLVDLSRSGYWARPEANAKDDPTSWYAFPEFSEGYRRMMHWYAIDIWRFFRDYNTGSGCQYRYLFRLDEDSCIHSMISYDVFDFFATNRYVYGFRLCAYEMAVARRMWTQWKRNNPEFVPVRELDLSMCGFYNNLFVADLNFFTSPEVSRFLDFIDRQGHIYRRRLGDLMIHTMAVIAFAPPDRVHRFLDFTYEHGTFNKKDGCLVWGGIQAGYDDPNASYTMNEFYRSKVLHTNCTVNATFLSEQDLSPTYSHLPTDRKGRLLLHTLVRGWVETSAGKGLLSG
jgi:alpha 1,2-mannosyltransferase